MISRVRGRATGIGSRVESDTEGLPAGGMAGFEKLTSKELQAGQNVNNKEPLRRRQTETRLSEQRPQGAKDQDRTKS